MTLAQLKRLSDRSGDCRRSRPMIGRVDGFPAVAAKALAKMPHRTWHESKFKGDLGRRSSLLKAPENMTANIDRKGFRHLGHSMTEESAATQNTNFALTAAKP